MPSAAIQTEARKPPSLGDTVAAVAARVMADGVWSGTLAASVSGATAGWADTGVSNAAGGAAVTSDQRGATIPAIGSSRRLVTATVHVRWRVAADVRPRQSACSSAAAARI